MRFNTFAELESYILENGIVKKIALCGAHDEPALSALVEAKRKGVASGVLIGDEPAVRALLAQLGEDPADYVILHEPDEEHAAKKAVALTKAGEADIPMKGLMQTSSYMRAILNKETGILPAGRVLSECTAFEYPDQGRMMFVTDCAVNIAPGLWEKKEIVKNAAELAKKFGIETVKVAAMSALEKVNPKIPSTVEAQELAAAEWPEGVVVEGPFALDNAVDLEAAQHKGIQSVVAGKADVLAMPDLCSANVIHKGLHFFAHLKTAGALCGTEIPVILTSRTDSPNTKYNSILTAILQAL